MSDLRIDPPLSTGFVPPDFLTGLFAPVTISSRPMRDQLADMEEARRQRELDEIHGPRLGPGRDEWRTAIRPIWKREQIRSAVRYAIGDRRPGKFIRAASGGAAGELYDEIADAIRDAHIDWLGEQGIADAVRNILAIPRIRG